MYTDRFGGSTVQPADVSYRALALSASVVLDWPALATDNEVLARIMDVTPSVASLNVTLPDATLASPGADVLMRNLGANSFTVLNSTGGSVATLAPGDVRYLYLSDNTTAAGVWQAILFGVGSSTLDAAALAGLGTRAFGGDINVALPTLEFSASYTVLTNDRAKVFVWTGATGALNLPATTGLGGDFFIEVRNAGTSTLTVDPNGSETIDDSSTISLLPSESFFVHAGAGEWYTVGRGRNQQFNFTQLVKSLSGGTTVLTPTEAANVVQTYNGTLLSAQIVQVPSVVQVYYVSNQTSGAFSLTVKTSGVGSTVSIPSGQNAVLFCDGLNVINASTTVSGLSALVLGAGSAPSPSLAIRSADLGWYSPVSNAVSATTAGVERLRIDNTNTTIFNTLLANGNVALGDASSDTLTIAPAAVTWSNNPTHSGNHTFSGNVVVSGSATLNGNVVLGDASGDTLTIAPAAVTWSNNPTHSGNHTFSGNLTVNGNTVIGNATSDTLTIAPSAVTWSGNPTHSGNHIYSGALTAQGSFVLPGATTPAQTAEGSVVWDTDSDLLTVGDGVGRKTMVDVESTQTVTGTKTFNNAVLSAGSVGSSVTGTTQAVKTSSTTLATTEFTDRLRSMLSSATSGTAVLSDRGSLVVLAAGFTIPASVFAANDVFSLYNNTAGNLTITQGAGLTLRQSGTANTGARTLAQRGVATVVFISATEAVITGTT